VFLRLPGQGNQELIAISATSTGTRKLHLEFESRKVFKIYEVKIDFKRE